MTDKFQNKYRISSTRLQNWDYAAQGLYFITICTCNREYFFGEISAGVMMLNETGKLAEQFWLEIPHHFSFIELCNFVVMPNHVHGILIITSKQNVNTRLIAYPLSPPCPRTSEYTLPSESQIISPKYPQFPGSTPLQKTGGITGSKNPMFKNNISRIIRWYKGRCSFEIHKINSHFAWQSRFWDHIIRNNVEHQRIQKYILNNPAKWAKDKFFGT